MNLVTLALAGFAIATPAFAGLDNLDIKSDLRADYSLGVIAHDQREFILKEGYPEAQVGGYMSGIGMIRIRKKTLTNTGMPVADELADGLKKHFVGQQWLDIKVLATSAKDPRTEIDKKIVAAGLKRTLLVTINDLWAESYRNTSVNYKFTITVLDEQAKALAETEFTGVHDTKEWGDDAAAEIFAKLMTDTLSKPEFVTAFKVVETAVANDSTSVSTITEPVPVPTKQKTKRK